MSSNRGGRANHTAANRMAYAPQLRNITPPCVHSPPQHASCVVLAVVASPAPAGERLDDLLEDPPTAHLPTPKSVCKGDEPHILPSNPNAMHKAAKTPSLSTEGFCAAKTRALSVKRPLQVGREARLSRPAVTAAGRHAASPARAVLQCGLQLQWAFCGVNSDAKLCMVLMCVYLRTNFWRLSLRFCTEGTKV